MNLRRLFSIEIDYSSRIYGFDIMRGIGVLIVVIAHGRSKFEHYLNISTFISVLGFWLMDLFFVLSGFLIGSILIKLYEKQQQFSLGSAYDFWIRRWFRTLPNYYLALLLGVILWAAFGNFVFKNPKFLSYLVFCQSLVTPHPHFLQEAWTLCIEEWFYLLLPLLVLFFHRVQTRAGGPVNVRRNVFLAILVLFAVPTLIRLSSSLLVIPYAWIDTSRMVFFRLDTIAFGILAAWINRYYTTIFTRFRITFGILSVVFTGLYFVYFYTFILSVDSQGIDILPKDQSFLTDTFFITFSALSCFCSIPYMRSVKMTRPSWFARFITTISIISYSVYIFHRSVVLFIVDKLIVVPEGAHFLNLLVFFLYATLAILFSILIYKFFEHPMTELREKFQRK